MAEEELPPKPKLKFNFHHSIENAVALCGSDRVDWANSAQHDVQQWVRAAQKYMSALEDRLANADRRK